jgi:hypothetical protein
MGHFKTEMVNVIRTSKFENDDSSESFVVRDKLDYFGIYGVTNNHEIYSTCKSGISSNGKIFSILRYTTINRSKRYITLNEDWIDYKKDVADKPLILKYQKLSSEDLQKKNNGEIIRPYLFEDMKILNEEDESLYLGNIKELLLIDKDQWAHARYIIKKVKYEKEDEEKDIPATLHVDLMRPYFANRSGIQPKFKTTFIKSSYVYPVRTKIICVSKKDGNLITFEEERDHVRVVLNPNTYKMKIAEFKISYGNLKKGVEIEDSLFTSFPNNNNKRKCIDMIKVDLSIVPSSTDIKDEGVISSRVFFLPNFSLKKSGNCN